jgi:hypothetical protein
MVTVGEFYAFTDTRPDEDIGTEIYRDIGLTA